MGEPVTNVFDLEAVISHGIRLIGDGIDIFGVAGIAWSTSRFLRQQMAEQHYKLSVGMTGTDGHAIQAL